MATVAFDKQIEFCERYVKEMYEVLEASTQEAITEEPLDPRRFSRIRREWALWLTHEMENKLERFELTIMQVTGGPARDYDADGPVSNERGIARNIAFLRGVLRTEDLTRLRSKLVRLP